MRRLGLVLLLTVLAASLFALVGINKPTSAILPFNPGHNMTAVYYAASILDNHESFWDLTGEWSFRLNHASDWTDYAYQDVFLGGDVNFEPRSLTWKVSANVIPRGATSFLVEATEWDYGMPDYTSALNIALNIYDKPANVWIDNGWTYGDVIHYFKYFIFNDPPTVSSIGKSRSLVGVGETVSFSGSGYDPEWDKLSYEWDFGDGSPISTQQNPQHVYNSVGTKSVKLRVKDEFGAYSSWQTTTITVTKVVIDKTFVSNSRSSVGNMETIGFHAKWAHNNSDIADGDLYINETRYPINGTGWITITPTYGTVGNVTWVVTEVNCTDVTVYQKTISDPFIVWDKVQVTLSAAQNTVEAGTAASITWTAAYQYDGANFDGTITLNDTDLTKFAVGTFYYTTQSVSGGTYGITAFESNILAINFIDTIAPEANAGPDQTVNEDTLVTLDGSLSSDNLPPGVNSGIKSYKWTFADVTLDGKNPTHTFETPGAYPITLNITDAGGNWKTDVVVITVLDVTPPIASAGQDRTVNAGTTVTFNASDSSDNADIISYEWNFGDNTVGAGKTTDHTYANAGAYTVTLTVKDAAGNSATHSITITVKSQQAPPIQIGGEGFPMWIIGAVVAIAAVAAAGVLLLRKRKQPPK